ncbi:MAG TPA: bifunctional (p)ppGpp synthetase/guanosine-3',5'-bis(diphosphate) 3'-pyrophosphohydrolase [Gammaproteobacteria bacterium]|nr:bifunctional (p)ppGpp synthetase/guanosine-3',5'-bis(diphosphate) 3'-pyrophosphohydrolase [Gammaproteobacteria bacterium]
MVDKKSVLTYLPDGKLDLNAWIDKARHFYHVDDTHLIEKSIEVTEQFAKGFTTFYGKSCLEQGLEIAEVILQLKLDQAAVAAAMLTPVISYAHITPEKISEHLNNEVLLLLKGIEQMETLRSIQKGIVQRHDYTQIDRLRKMILAMVNDVRVVLIELAEQLVIMRGIKDIAPGERKRIGEETRDIYAPLANRLGIGQVKWELEDLALRYIDPITYKTISEYLSERRADREIRIQTMIFTIKEHLDQQDIPADIMGRAKHINSIYNKMLSKNLTIKNIYDISAIRIIVPTIEDCYKALSIVHSLYEHVPEEFDDYIATPKPNGYRSIHTAVKGPDEKNYEGQIRTYEMHEESERGIAAHWLYKEDKTNLKEYKTKINFLRQLLDWHREVAENSSAAINARVKQDDYLDDQIYTLTPAGKIIDLPKNATPIDFAYSIHTDVGHHCRGAKVNGRIVPLTHALQTGDHVEIITASEGSPSRDWLNIESGYVKSSRARSKISQWFKQHEISQAVETGKHLIEKESTRLKNVDLDRAAQKLHFKDTTALIAALGRGQIKISQLTQTTPKEQPLNIPQPTGKASDIASGVVVSGTRDFLTRIARCCKPIPPEAITGYITYGRGISIHRQDCRNLTSIDPTRLIVINWDQAYDGAYAVDLDIHAQHSTELLKEITGVFSNAKINMIAMRSLMSNNHRLAWVNTTIQIHDVNELTQVVDHLKQLPLVIEVKRKK